MSVETSVIVPVYNDSEGLRTTLDSLVEQTVDGYEVVVVDNGSTDATPAVAEAYEAEFACVERVDEIDVQSSYAARNRGLDRSSGDVIGFLDADVWVDRDYVESITRSVVADECMYVGCNIAVVSQDEEHWVSRYDSAAAFPVEQYIDNEHFAPTACLVVHRRLLDAVGTFDGRLVSGGDLEFGRRVAARGYLQRFERDISVYHPARSSVRSVLKKQYRVGRGLEQLTCSYPDRFPRENDFLHPQHYLPVHPVGFYARFRKRTKYPTEVVWWYLLSWLSGISKTAGRIAVRRRCDREADSPERR